MAAGLEEVVMGWLLGIVAGALLLYGTAVVSGLLERREHRRGR